MHRAWTLLTILLVTATLAGCVDSDPEPADEPIIEEDDTPRASGLIPVAPDQSIFVGTIVEDHATGATGHAGHQIRELHTGHEGLELLDHNDLSEGLIGPGSGFTELHVVGDLALISSLQGSRGVTIANVSDPANMRVVSHIYNMDDNWDARLSADGRFLFLGCQGSSTFDCTGVDTSGESPGATGGGPCAPLATCDGGIAIYSLLDPANPSFIDYIPMGFTHNVYTFMKDDKYYFMNDQIAIAEWDPATGNAEIATTEIQGGHDVAVQQHPLTGDWLLYTGAGAYMAIWNVTDPFHPELLATFEPEQGESVPAMWHEQTPMPCLIDGRHITIGAGEDGLGSAQPIAIVDTTDPTTPDYLGQWQLPDAASLSQQASYRFSLHNVDGSCDGQVAVGHYHAGVWVFDISTEERMAEPVTLAYYQPHELAPAGSYSPVVSAPIGALVTADAPNVWAAQWSADGQTLFIPDMTSGLYALTPTWEFEPMTDVDDETDGSDDDSESAADGHHAHQH